MILLIRSSTEQKFQNILKAPNQSSYYGQSYVLYN